MSSVCALDTLLNQIPPLTSLFIRERVVRKKKERAMKRRGKGNGSCLRAGGKIKTFNAQKDQRVFFEDEFI